MQRLMFRGMLPQDVPVADAKPDDIKDLLGGALFRALYKWMEETGPVYLLPTGSFYTLVPGLVCLCWVCRQSLPMTILPVCLLGSNNINCVCKSAIHDWLSCFLVVSDQSQTSMQGTCSPAVAHPTSFEEISVGCVFTPHHSLLPASCASSIFAGPAYGCWCIAARTSILPGMQLPRSLHVILQQLVIKEFS